VTANWRRVGRLSYGGVLVAVAVCVTAWPDVSWWCGAMLAGLLCGPFGGAALDCHEDRHLRRRSMFGHRPLTRRELRRLDHLLRYSPRMKGAA
jgi:hypothetical protein